MALPRDWSSRSLRDESVAVSSTGLSGPCDRSRGSVVSVSSCSSYQALPLYQPDGTAGDLKVFTDAFRGHLQAVTTCLSQSDRDVLTAAHITQHLFAELIDSAQVISHKLSAIARSALEQLPTLLWLARGHQSDELQVCIAELYDGIATLCKDLQTIRTDYIDLLKQVQYVGQCTRVAMDQIVTSSLPQPAEDETGSLECTARDALELTDAQKEVQKYLEVSAMHLDGQCHLLEECSDFWLMLHEAELQLRKLAKESKVISEGQGDHHRRGKSTLQSFCEHLRSFSGLYSGLPRHKVKSHQSKGTQPA